MGFFSQQKATVLIDAENSVVVRKLTYGEQQAAMSASMQFEMSMGQDGKSGNTATGKLDPFGMKREELITAIVSWEGPGFEGRAVTRENILALPPEIIDAIQTVVSDLNAGAGADEKKALTATTSTA
jgi:hypothetical protein